MRKQIILIDEESVYLLFGYSTKTYTKNIPSSMYLPPLIKCLVQDLKYDLFSHICIYILQGYLKASVQQFLKYLNQVNSVKTVGFA